MNYQSKVLILLPVFSRIGAHYFKKKALYFRP
jgi:hypothetical protein